MKSLFFALCLVLLAKSGLAFAELKWAHQGGDLKIKRPNGTETKLIDDQLYQRPPQIQKGACSENGAPVCVGYVLRTEEGKLPSVGPSACKAVKKDGKWTCPTAKVCYDDEDVNIEKLAKMPEAAPAPAAPAAAHTPGAGSPEAQREGGKE